MVLKRVCRWIGSRAHWLAYGWIALLSVQLPSKDYIGLRLALSDIVLAICVLAFAIVRVGTSQRRASRTSLDLPLTFLGAAFVIGAVVTWRATGSLPTYVGVNKLVGLAVLVVSFYMLVWFLDSSEKLHRAGDVLVRSVGLVNLIGLVLYGLWSHVGLPTQVVMEGGRFVGWLIDPNAWCGLLVVAFFLQAGGLLHDAEHRRWIWMAERSIAFLLLVGIILTRSRSGWLAFLVGGCLLLWTVRRRVRVKHVLAGIAVAAGALGVSALLAWDSLFALASSAAGSFSIAVRWEQIIAGVQSFSTSPWVGIGLGGHLLRGNEYIIHTTYVWFLVELGLIGFLGLGWLLVRTSRLWLDGWKTRCRGLVVGGAVAFASMLGLAIGIEAFYQRHLWLLFAFAEGIRRVCPVSVPASDRDDIAPRILLVSTVAGTLRGFLMPHIRMLRELGWKVEAAARFRSHQAESLEAEGVKTHDVPFSRRVMSTSNVRGLFRLQRVLRDESYDIIHVHTPIAAMLGRLAALRISPRPVVLYTAHGLHFHRHAPWYNWLLYYPLEWLAARWTDALVVMNHEDYEIGQRLGFLSGQSLFSVHGVGVNLSTYASGSVARSRVRSELHIAEAEPVAICVAEFSAEKGYDILLDAWRLVMKNAPGAHLLLAGAGAKLAWVRREVAEWKDSRVHILGYRRDIPELLGASDVFVLASEREGLPRCIMEAMAGGLPVVATAVRGSADLVVHEKTGVLVEPHDAAALADALRMLLQDPGLRRRMGDQGRERVSEYSEDRVLAEMRHIYEFFV